MARHPTWSEVRDEVRRDPAQAAEIDAFKSEFDALMRAEDALGPTTPKQSHHLGYNRLIGPVKVLAQPIGASIRSVGKALAHASPRSGSWKSTGAAGRFAHGRSKHGSPKKRKT